MEHNMSWTEITREQYRREGLRYASDTTDEEWQLMEPLMPPPCRCGRPREVDLREVVNAILYIAATGCQWRALPKDFPPCSTVRYYFYKWRGSGLWRSVNDALVRWMREMSMFLISRSICTWKSSPASIITALWYEKFLILSGRSLDMGITARSTRTGITGTLPFMAVSSSARTGSRSSFIRLPRPQR